MFGVCQAFFWSPFQPTHQWYLGWSFWEHWTHVCTGSLYAALSSKLWSDPSAAWLYEILPGYDNHWSASSDQSSIAKCHCKILTVKCWEWVGGGGTMLLSTKKKVQLIQKKLYFKSFTQIIYLLEQNMCHKSVKWGTFRVCFLVWILALGFALNSIVWKSSEMTRCIK